MIHKEALQDLLARRPELVQQIAEIVEARRQGLRAVQDLNSAPPEKKALVRRSAGELVQLMRRFFGL